MTDRPIPTLAAGVLPDGQAAEVNALLDELRALRAEKAAADAEWEPGRWWRTVDPEGRLWCESSDEVEVRASMRPGDRLERRYERAEAMWRAEP